MRWLKRRPKAKSLKTSELVAELRERDWTAIPRDMAARLYEDNPRAWELYWEAYVASQETRSE